MLKYFGTDGYRGLVGKELTSLKAYKLGEFLGHKFRGGKILIAQDTRISSEMLKSAICAAVSSMACDIDDIGISTTPSVAYLVSSNSSYQLGIMISASHNPYYDNGIKLFNAKGEKMDDIFLAELEQYLDQDQNYPVNTEIGKISKRTDLISLYQNYLQSIVQTQQKYNLVLDCANGSAAHVAPILFESYANKLIAINIHDDGYNINVDCGSTHIEKFLSFLQKNNQSYDLAFAFDGDADRLISIYQGQILTGDHYLYLVANYLKDSNPNYNRKIVTTQMANIGLYKKFDQHDIDYHIVQVGDKYVYEKMKIDDIDIGGEQSGHIIFKQYATTGDGILSALFLLKVLDFYGKDKFNQLVQELIIYPQKLINIEVKNKNFVMKNQELLTEISEINQKLADNGRILIRASGTENLVRVMCEAATTSLCEQYCQHFQKIIEEINEKYHDSNL